jgi:O-antigen/teichoic acid export membrane protein
MLATGTALSQLITLAFSPLIARLYGPSAFGALSVFTSTVTVIGGCSTLAYAYAIALPKGTGTAYQLL